MGLVYSQAVVYRLLGPFDIYRLCHEAMTSGANHVAWDVLFRELVACVFSNAQ